MSHEIHASQILNVTQFGNTRHVLEAYRIEKLFAVLFLKL